VFDSKSRLADQTFASITDMIRAYAQEAVRLAREQHRVRLDFTPGSIDTLEHLLQGQAAVDLDFQSRLWGSYLGEVMRFRWDGEWLLAPYPGGGASAVPTLDIRGSRLYPTMKIYRRLTLGPAESLTAFYRMAADRLDRPAPENAASKAAPEAPISPAIAPPPADPTPS
jgi:hypothetical protein